MNILTYIKVKEFLQKHGFAICMLCGTLVMIVYGISIAHSIIEAGGLRTVIIDAGKEILSIVEAIKE